MKEENKAQRGYTTGPMQEHLSNIYFTSAMSRVMIFGELALDKVVNLFESKVIQSLLPVIDLNWVSDPNLANET